MSGHKTRNKLLFIFFFILILLYAFCNSSKYSADNQWSRYALIKSIALKGSFALEQKDCMSDWSFHNGHYYSNKAPGTSYFGAPIYLALYHLEKIFKFNPDALSLFNLKIISFFIASVPTVLICIFMYLFFLSHFPNLENKLLIVSAYSLGTLAFPLSTMLWGHQLAACFLFLSYYFIKISKKYFLGGLFVGFAVFTEYPSALLIPAYIVLIFFLSFRTGEKKSNYFFKNLFNFILGGLIPLTLLMHYHYTCFGSVLSTPYDFENPIFKDGGISTVDGLLIVGDYSQLMNTNNTFLGINYEALLKLLFGAKKGLFFIYPITIIGFLGLCIKRNYLCLFAFFSFLILNATLSLWEGGTFNGPRYLAPIIPFLFLEPVLFKKRWLSYLFLLISVLNTIAIVSVNMMVPSDVESVLYEVIYPGILGNIWSFSFVLLLAVFMLSLSYFENKQNLLLNK